MKCLIPFMLALTICSAVWGGDLPESILSLENTDVFIGEITDIKDGMTTIAVYEALFNNYDVGAIIVPDFYYMTGDDEHRFPAIGDYVAVAAEYTDKKWEISYRSEGASWERFSGLVAKSDGTDPKTLKLYAGGYGFTERMNVYINDGTYSYENRIKALSADASDVSADSGAGETDTQSKNLAEETEIVVPPPKTVNSTSGKLYDKPFFRYIFLTLSSMLIGFAVSKAVAKRRGL